VLRVHSVFLFQRVAVEKIGVSSVQFPFFLSTLLCKASFGWALIALIARPKNHM